MESGDECAAMEENTVLNVAGVANGGDECAPMEDTVLNVSGDENSVVEEMLLAGNDEIQLVLYRGREGSLSVISVSGLPSVSAILIGSFLISLNDIGWFDFRSQKQVRRHFGS